MDAEESLGWVSIGRRGACDRLQVADQAGPLYGQGMVQIVSSAYVEVSGGW